jgi:uncharacterized membrane protein YedE/YeeE
MMEIWNRAQPLQGFIGGILIGASCALMLVLLGRIAGVSGLLARAMQLTLPRKHDTIAVFFILGLPLGALVIDQTHGPIEIIYPNGDLFLILAGLLVGFGARLGSGCTSGHGVCGISRLSPRSLLATIVFMVSGFITVALMRSVGLAS